LCLDSEEVLELALDAVVRALRATAPTAAAVDDVHLEGLGQGASEAQVVAAAAPRAAEYD